MAPFVGEEADLLFQGLDVLCLQADQLEQLFLLTRVM